MASIFDQYEASMGREPVNPFEQSTDPFQQPPSRGHPHPEPVKYSNMRVADETPIFTRNKVGSQLCISHCHLLLVLL